jgi:hypothetical protein
LIIDNHYLEEFYTPDLAVAFEQLKYALRGEARIPHLYYEGKAMKGREVCSSV